MADERQAFKKGGEVRKREILSELNWFSRPNGSKFLRSFRVCFTGDNYEAVALRQENVAELDPVFDRPIFCFATAPRMKRDRCLSVVAVTETTDRVAILIIREEAR